MLERPDFSIDRTGTTRKALAFGTCLAALVLPLAAQAQENAQGGDIIVTAQRDPTLASKTPIAITAIGGDALLNKGVTNVVQLASEVPSLEINRYFGLQITIRGVSNSDTTAKGDPSAAFLLNGVYVARPQAQEVSFFDLDRVEVLRGPQGTLYGRNSTAGVINVISRRPGDVFEVTGNIGYGNYDNRQADLAVNLPIGDTAAIRVAGSYDRRDSYYSNAPGDTYSADPFKDNKSLRISGRWDITPDLQVLVIGDYTSLKGIPELFVEGSSFYATGADGDTDNRVYVASSSTSDRLQRGYSQTLDPYADDHSYGLHGELAWNMGPVTATYIGSYRRFTMDEAYTDLLGQVAPTYTNQEYDQYSHELRFSLNDVRGLKLQVGGMYFNEKSYQYFDQPDYYGFDHFILDYGPTKSKSYAVFGQATYSLTDTFRLTGGLRYTRDEKSQFGLVILDIGGVEIPSAGGASVSFSKATWRVGLDYDLSPTNLLYATVSTGYKAGGFNDGCLAGSTPGGQDCGTPLSAQQLFYEPETITAYEAGLKGRTTDGSFRYALTGFYYDYRDLQLSTTTYFQGAAAQLIQNAGKARIYGLELEATLRPSPRNTLSIFASLLDAKYTEYLPLGADGPDYAGRPLDRSPKSAITASYTYSLPFASGASLDLDLRSKMSASYVLGSSSTVQMLRQPSFTRTEASATYNAPGGRWYLQGYVRNIENDIQMSATTNISGVLAIVPTDPRTYGARLGFHF
ncbi:TonB-dependent receptor [Novosphingobium profundi]|uniref:TonB-dependent receptor n=1 Tax=Novosphingobium profundi TaxID=1774954 RepID=UPI001BD97A64|nr:TonB-dependent receptor [Novosphingobium profundi]MBT0670720.1 TonB-dependent receptor [Novosphingobium profundi]